MYWTRLVNEQKTLKTKVSHNEGKSASAKYENIKHKTIGSASDSQKYHDNVDISLSKIIQQENRSLYEKTSHQIPTENACLNPK